MASGFVIKSNRYYDSVFLMQIAERISSEPGIEDVATLMGTERNKELLAEIGFDHARTEAATPNDLIIAINGEDQTAIDKILANIETWFTPPKTGPTAKETHSTNQALVNQPGSNLAVISIPGEYAARETSVALDLGLNVFLFSDNVSIEDEVSLKKKAADLGLILMGPDCGTAIISGVGIGFSNAVRRGPIGVIGVAGTGLQEFTSLVHQGGSGISHAIGTGGRDLSDGVGGLTTRKALEILEEDPLTEIIAIVSKPPGEKTLPHLVKLLLNSRKPLVVCLLGVQNLPMQPRENDSITNNIDDAAEAALNYLDSDRTSLPRTSPDAIQGWIKQERSLWSSEQRYLRGLFAGGTFCYQAQVIARDAGLRVYSSTPLSGMQSLDDPFNSQAHTLLDMGDDLFTRRRPHPMIDASLRKERILAEASDNEVAVLLLDIVLGYNASSDPAGDLIDAITQAKATAKDRNGHLSIVASVNGTDDDPQNRKDQMAKLTKAGVLVFNSAAQAAQAAVDLVKTFED